MKLTHLVPVLSVLVFAAAQPTSNAKPGRVSLEALARRADCIAMAQVQRVTTRDGLKVAEVLPQKVWKGNAREGSIFYVVAEPVWTCDTSTAKPGEKVLLFLVRSKNSVVERRFWRKPPVRVNVSPLFFIAHSGRGRMPLRVVGSTTYVTLWTDDVTLPSHFRTIAGPGARFARFIRSAPLADIVQSIGQKHAGLSSVR